MDKIKGIAIVIFTLLMGVMLYCGKQLLNDFNTMSNQHFQIEETHIENEIKEEEEEEHIEIQEEITEPIIEEEKVETPSPQYISLGTYKITAYCGCAKCCGKTDGITASGTHVTAGRTIAAPKEIPFGTKIMINGHVYTVEDRGGAIKGNRIDIYFTIHEEALQYGVQYHEIFKVVE